MRPESGNVDYCTTIEYHAGHEGHPMFHPDVFTLSPCNSRPPRLLAAITVITLATVCCRVRPIAARAAGLEQQTATQNKPQTSADRSGGAAERKLLSGLEAAIANHADHLDFSRLDRELADAFRGYALDLDKVDAKTAGARLAGHPETPGFAAAIDEWARVRRTRLKLDSWRRLVAVARAADPDLWRNKLRDQFDRPARDAMPALKALAAEGNALEQQPANSLMLLAQMLYEADELAPTIAVVRAGRRRFPRDFWLCMLDGRLQAYRIPKPDPAGAVKTFTAAVALRPQSVMAHTNLAVLLQQSGKPAEAAAEITEALRLRPTSAENQLSLGYALEQTGKLDAAIAAYREAIQKKPDDSQSHSYLGTALSQQGKHDEAIAASREAVRLDPDDANPELGLGYVLERAGKPDEAIASYREAIRKSPGRARCHSYLGTAFVQQRKFDEAIAAFREAIRLRSR